MNVDHRKKFYQLVSAILNAGAEDLREEKLMFAEAMLRGKNASNAFASAMPNWSFENQQKEGVNPILWESDPFVISCKALMRVACPELLIPTREEMVANLRAASLKADCRPIDLLRINKFIAEISGYVKPKV